MCPEDMPDEIWITDTTFRDGQQSVSPFTPEQIVHLFKLMSRLSGPKGVVRQSEFFLYTDKDKEALRRCQTWACASRKSPPGFAPMRRTLNWSRPRA